MGSPLAAVVVRVRTTRLLFLDLLTLVVFQQPSRDARDAGLLVFIVNLMGFRITMETRLYTGPQGIL